MSDAQPRPSVSGHLRATVNFEVVRIQRGFFATVVRLRDNRGHEFDVRAGDKLEIECDIDLTPQGAMTDLG